jgi:predicted NAD/FAD-binding protein
MIIGGKKAHDFGDCSIGEYLDREGYSKAFRDDYLIVRIMDARFYR